MTPHLIEDVNFQAAFPNDPVKYAHFNSLFVHAQAYLYAYESLAGLIELDGDATDSIGLTKVLDASSPGIHT